MQERVKWISGGKTFWVKEKASINPYASSMAGVVARKLWQGELRVGEMWVMSPRVREAMQARL